MSENIATYQDNIDTVLLTKQPDGLGGFTPTFTPKGTAVGLIDMELREEVREEYGRILVDQIRISTDYQVEQDEYFLVGDVVYKPVNYTKDLVEQEEFYICSAYAKYEA